MHTQKSMVFLLAMVACFAKNTGAGTGGPAKGKLSGASVDTVIVDEHAATETVTEPTTAPASPFTVVPQKIGVKIGLRSRYFDTVEQAQAAIDEYTERNSKKSTTGRAHPLLTPEQKAERIANREALMKFSGLLGKEGKMQAALANSIEDIIAVIPAVFPLIKEYNDAPRDEVTTEAPVETTELPDVAVEPLVNESIAPAEQSVDPLAEFAL